MVAFLTSPSSLVPHSNLISFWFSLSLAPATHERFSMSILFDPLRWVSRAIPSGLSSSFGYKIHPSLTKLVKENPFSRLSYEHPYHHLWEEERASSNRGLLSMEFELSPQVYLKFFWKYLSRIVGIFGKRALHANPTLRSPYGAFFLIFFKTMSWGSLRKEWLE